MCCAKTSDRALKSSRKLQSQSPGEESPLETHMDTQHCRQQAFYDLRNLAGNHYTIALCCACCIPQRPHDLQSSLPPPSASLEPLPAAPSCRPALLLLSLGLAASAGDAAHWNADCCGACVH